MKYRGLENEGATCYMNSLLQTLFMTAEFRKEMYKYRFDEKKEESTQDSIPYQLQQLFLRLQNGEKKRANTVKLIKSFQWDEADAFQQHDVQQFCRVLFDAVENATQKDWIKNLYEGSLRSFICCENGHISERFENFMDLSLTIKNTFENIEYSSVEQSLKGYLKPTHLDSSNKYLCEDCGDKVEADKGVRFTKLPPILTLQLNRFELNYQTMQREKINKFFYFPQILEMHRFMNAYEDLKVKLPPADLMKMQVSQPVANKQASNNSKYIQFMEKTAKPEKIRKKSEEKERPKEETRLFDEDKLKQKVNQTSQLSEQQKKLRNIELMKTMRLGKGEIDQKFKKLQRQQKLKPKDNLEDDFLFGIGAQIIAQSTNWDEIKEAKPKKTVMKYQHTEETYTAGKEYPEHTYSLFAILVHRGGAHHGHYFAYINDGEDWYEFNDESVKKVTQFDVRKYGDNKDNENAYMLFYRDTKTFVGCSLKDLEAPGDLLESLFIEEENDKIEEKKVYEMKERNEEAKVHRSLKSNFVRLTVYKNNIEFVHMEYPDSHQVTLMQLKDRVKKQFNIVEEDKDWRLRRYSKYEDIMLDGYDHTPENLEKTLLELNMKEQVGLIVQRKEPNEVFEAYDPRRITIKANVWREGLTLLTEQLLKPIKIIIYDEAPFRELVQKIEEKTGISNPLIIRRTFTSKTPFEIDSKPDNMDKGLLKMRYFNSLNLYVEQQQPAGGKPKWQNEFEDQKFRFMVRFNNPQLPDGDKNKLELCFDRRKNFMELKNKLSEIIGVPTNEFRVKRSNKTFPEIVELRKKINDLSIVGSELYLQLGRSTKGLVTIYRGIVIDHSDGQLEFIRQDMEQYEMDNTSTVANLKIEISTKHPDVPIESIRIRQKTERFGEIFKDDVAIDKIVKFSLIWQEVKDQCRGMSIYIKKYDAEKHQLSPLQEIYVEYDASYQQFAAILSDQLGIAANKIYGHRVDSGMFEPDDLPKAEWFNVNSFEGKIYQSPMFIKSDGDYVILKEGNVVTHTVKKQIFGGTNWSLLNKADGKEKSLKITVKKKNDEKAVEKLEQPVEEETEQPQKTE